MQRAKVSGHEMFHVASSQETECFPKVIKGTELIKV